MGKIPEKTERNQRIYKMVVEDKMKAENVANIMHITIRRINQIIKREKVRRLNN